MIFQLDQHNRIELNQCGGFDWRKADVDAKTGFIRTHPKTNTEKWDFHEHHPKLEQLLESYVMQTPAISNDTLMDAYSIVAALHEEYANVARLFGEVGKALNEAVLERDRLREQLKAKKGSTAQ